VDSDRIVRIGLRVDTEVPAQSGSSGLVVTRDGKTEPYDVKIVATTSKLARDGGVIPMSAWRGRLEHFLQNPVVQWAHQHWEPPIGRVVHMELTDDAMIHWWRFNRVTDLSRQVALLYEIGDMKAASVGFRIHKMRDPDDEERAQGIQWVAEDAELYEVSAVPVGADPYALAIEVERAIARAKRSGADVRGAERTWYHLRAAKSVEASHEAQDPPEQRRAAIPFSVHKSYEVAPKSASWDASAEVSKMDADASVLRPRHAWVDREADADTKSAYKFPHHRAGEGMAVVFRALAAGMARLDQANVPDDDKDGIYRHLAQHYRKDYDAEPPEREALDALLRDVPEREDRNATALWLREHGEALRALGGGDLALGLAAVRDERADPEVAAAELAELWMMLQEKLPQIIAYLKDEIGKDAEPEEAREQDTEADDVDPDPEAVGDREPEISEDELRAVVRETVGPLLAETVKQMIWSMYGTVPGGQDLE